MVTTLPSSPKVGMVSLGCPKALVDSERILTKLRSDGYDLSASYEDADVVLVNTCGFLDSAKEESLEAIGEAMAEKIGRASCRERVCQYVTISVVAVSLKQKKIHFNTLER